MTFEQIQSRIDQGEKIGESIPVYEAMLALIQEMRQFQELQEARLEEREPAPEAKWRTDDFG